ncbi:MAG: DUF1957 domain-containing protein [Anaerolineae bacterium]|nr:DUF1957 domain-containing protein [Anaerolineae bacterium]
MTAIGALTVILHTHLPYVRLAGRWPHGEEWIHEALSESYIPLLRSFYQLRAEGVPFRLTISFTPVLCEQLSDPLVLEHFETYLSERIAAAKRDIALFATDGPHPNGHLYYLAHNHKEWLQGVRQAYEQQFKRDIVGAFRLLQDEGYLEIATSAATHAYLPLLAEDGTLRAQLQAAIANYERHFGRRPRSIWLPECGYRPAFVDDEGRLRQGFEALLQELGLTLFFAEAHTISGGRQPDLSDSVGPYGSMARRYVIPPSPELPARAASTFQAYWVGDSADPQGKATQVTVIGRNWQVGQQVWSSEWGYPGDFDYREFHKRAASSGLPYWRVTGANVPLDAKDVYHPDWAACKVEQHAEHYIHLIGDLLRDQQQQTQRYSLVAVSYDTELFGHWWFEGVAWLEQVLRLVATVPQIDMLTAHEYLALHPPQQTLQLPESSWGAGGSHFTWDNPQVRWMWPPIHQAEARMVALARRFSDPAPLERQALNQAARELFLLLCSDWQFLITTGQAREYASQRFQQHLERFEALAEQLERGQIHADELARLMEQDKLLPEMDYRWFAES